MVQLRRIEIVFGASEWYVDASLTSRFDAPGKGRAHSRVLQMLTLLTYSWQWRYHVVRLVTIYVRVVTWAIATVWLSLLSTGTAWALSRLPLARIVLGEIIGPNETVIFFFLKLPLASIFADLINDEYNNANDHGEDANGAEGHQDPLLHIWLAFAVIWFVRIWANAPSGVQFEQIGRPLVRVVVRKDHIDEWLISCYSHLGRSYSTPAVQVLSH